MKHFLYNILLLLTLSGCWSQSENLTIPETVQHSEIFMGCMDMVSQGGQLQVAINTQPAYDSLIYARFQKPLDDYWRDNYDSVLYHVRENHPALSDSEYAILVRDVFYQLLPFRGTDSCTQPTIDFRKFTMLGMSSAGGGCNPPDYYLTVLRDRTTGEVLYRIEVLQHGTCDIAFTRNSWVLIPKLAASEKVRFQTLYLQD